MEVYQTAVMVTSIATTVGAIATAVILFMRGSSSVKNDLIVTYERRVDQLEKDVKHLTDSLNERKEENAKLRGNIEIMERILENRDPKLQQAIDALLKFMERIEEHMEDHTVAMKESH